MYFLLFCVVAAAFVIAEYPWIAVIVFAAGSAISIRSKRLLFLVPAFLCLLLGIFSNTEIFVLFGYIGAGGFGIAGLIVWRIVYVFNEKDEQTLLKDERKESGKSKTLEEKELQETKTTASQASPKVVNEGTVTVPHEIKGMPLKYRYQNVKIAIIKGEDPDYDAISPGDMITLIQEPSNKYDTNAVIVMANEIKLGYLYKGALQEIANRFLKSQLPIFSCISTIEDDTRTIEIFLGFYQDDYSSYQHSLDSGKPHKKFKLVSNFNEEMQDTISSLYWSDNYKGTKVFLHYDYDKDKYCVSDIDDIGYMPKSAHQHIEAGNLDTAFIEDIIENENDKYVVTVTLPLEKRKSFNVSLS